MIRFIDNWIEEQNIKEEKWLVQLDEQYKALQKRNAERARAAIRMLGEKWVLHPNYKGVKQ